MTVAQPSKVFSGCYGLRMFHHIHKSPPLDSILTQTDPVHVFRYQNWTSILVWIFQLRVGVPRGLFTLDIRNKKFMFTTITEMVNKDYCHVTSCVIVSVNVSDEFADIIRASDTLLTTKTTQWHISEDSNLHNHRSENLKSHRDNQCDTSRYHTGICRLIRGME
jgi:hypothetical protein